MVKRANRRNGMKWGMDDWLRSRGSKRKRRKLRYLPGWMSRHETNVRRLNRKDRHDTKRDLRP